MTLPLVTIGIPTFNRANGYLRETLESALAQTYPNLDIVVADNCSPDDTTAVVKSYNDARVRYFRHDPGTKPNDNFNFCLSQARGEFFLLLHDDDLIDHDFIETCLGKAALRTDVGVIRAGVRDIDANGNVINEGRNDVEGTSTGDLFLAWLEGRTSQYLCGTMFNTSELRSIGGFRSRHNLFQDVMATFRVVARRGRVELPAVKASARKHGGKWAHTSHVQKWCEDSADLLELMCELAPDRTSAIRERGQRFFATSNFRRASNIRSPFRRFSAYAFVYQFFGARYLPPARMVLRSTALYRGLRQAKRKLLGLPAWAD